MPGQVLGGHQLEQLLHPGHGCRRGVEIPGPPGHRQAEHRGAQPGRSFLVGRKILEDCFRRVECVAVGHELAIGQLEGGRDQRGLWSGPRPVVWHRPEAVGERAAARWLGELADRQLAEDQLGGQRPVAGRHRLPDGVQQQPVDLVPPGRAPVQVRHLPRALEPELQAQDFGEQRVIAVPAIPERLDESVGSHQRGEGTRGLFVTGQLTGDAGVDPVQDAGLQQQVPDVGRLVVERLRHQVTGDGAVLGGEFLDELPGVRVLAERDRRQAQSRGPALIQLRQEFQRPWRQRDAVLCHQQAGFGNAEG